MEVFVFLFIFQWSFNEKTWRKLLSSVLRKGKFLKVFEKELQDRESFKRILLSKFNSF